MGGGSSNAAAVLRLLNRHYGKLSSEELAAKVDDLAMRGGRAAFVIGGSLGLSDAIKSRAAAKISFGRITLPHQLMRVVLAEQLYRAFKINNHESYHK